MQLTLPDILNTDLGVPRDKVWIISGEKNISMENYYTQSFLDSSTGLPVFGKNDLIVRRHSSGVFQAYSASSSFSKTSKIDLDHFLKIKLRSRAAPVRKSIIAVDIRDPRNGSKFDSNSFFPRNNLETILKSAISDELNVLALRFAEFLIAKEGVSENSLIYSLFRRKYSAYILSNRAYQEFGLTPASIERVYSSVMSVANQIGIHRLTRSVSLSFNKFISEELQYKFPFLEGDEPDECLNVGLSRISGFSIDIASSTPKIKHIEKIPHRYKFLGEIPVTDAEIIEILSGFQDPVRRLIAELKWAGNVIRLKAKVIGETEAFFRSYEPYSPQNEVEAIQVSCNVLKLRTSPLAMYPKNCASFEFKVDKKNIKGSIQLVASLQNEGCINMKIPLSRSMRENKKIFIS